MLHLFCYIKQNLQVPSTDRPIDYESKSVWWSLNKQSEQRFTAVTSADTIGHTTLGLLQEAGVDTAHFKAHSLRGAAANAYIQKGVAADMVCAKGGWASEAFDIFYKRTQIPHIGVKQLIGDTNQPEPGSADLHSTEVATTTHGDATPRLRRAQPTVIDNTTITDPAVELTAFCKKGKKDAGLPLVRKFFPNGKPRRIPGANTRKQLYCAICDGKEQSTLM